VYKRQQQILERQLINAQATEFHRPLLLGALRT